MLHVSRHFVLLLNGTSFSDHNEQIRSKLPNVGYYLRRLMRLKSGGNLESEKEPINNISEMTEITESMLNRAMLEISMGKCLYYGN